MKKILIIFTSLILSFASQAQQLKQVDSDAVDSLKNIKFKYKQLIIPVVLTSYGFVALHNSKLLEFNRSVRNEIIKDNHSNLHIDDYSQYIPALTVYALNNLGVKGKNNLRNRSVILATSLGLVATSVTALKSVTNIERPDESSNNSFPSGHTALAFAGAEFLYQEYKDQSIWYGISGYLVATATGGLRMYNNRHWLNDVVAGAGIGILCTKTAYWLNPYINKILFNGKNSSSSAAIFSPYYDGKTLGGSFAMSF